MLDNSLRFQYLQAIGIDVWVSREDQSDLEFCQLDEISVEAPSQTFVAPKISEPCKQIITLCRNSALTNQTTSEQANSVDWLFIADTPPATQNTNTEVELLFIEMRRSLGITENADWISSTVPCPPPPKGLFNQEDLAESCAFIEQQIVLFKPKLIVLLGEFISQQLLQTEAPLKALRGTIHKFAAISTIVTYHPHFLLQAPLEKRNAWLDLQLALTTYHEVNRL
jgi:uracil-DNA glycosylase